MSSRLLDNLNQQLSQAHEQVAWGRIQAQRALYFARHGQREAATELVAAVRQEFAATPHAEVTAWISLAEALNKFYAKPGAEGMDRLRRAEALARAIQHPVLVPLCAAWLAHFEFNANRMEAMALHASQALSQAQGDHHAALARVSLVLADAYHHAGRFDLAKPWYARVREHALADGDDAMISAMLHNVAALRANNARLDDAFGLAVPAEVSRAMLEAESTKNYDFGIGTLSLTTLVPLVRAQLLTIQRKFEEAISLFDVVLNDSHPEDLERRDASHRADRAWCLYSIGRTADSIAAVEDATARILPVSDVDDLACTHARIGAVYRGTRSDALALHHESLAQQHLASHGHHQKQLLASLSELVRMHGVR